MSWRLLLAIVLFAHIDAAAEESRRLLQPEDILAAKGVEEPQISIDGKRIVYVLRSQKAKEDKNISNLWIINWDGTQNRPLTFGSSKTSRPRFSSDNRWLAFLSSRGDDVDQLWLLPVDGGEAERLTNIKGGIEDFAWSPHSKNIVIVGKDPDEKPTGPIVIDRFRFKKDGEDYLTQRYSHLYLVNVESRKTVQLTQGNHDELKPCFSPDGKEIVFVTKRGMDPDRSEDWNLYAVEAKAGGKERQVTSSREADNNPDWDSSPVFSPDGKWIAYLHGGAPHQIEYATHRLAIVSSKGADVQILTPKLDRNVFSPHWSEDGKSILVIVEDDGRQKLARVDVKDLSIHDVAHGDFNVLDYDVAGDKQIIVRTSSGNKPEELYAVKNGALTQVTKQNESFVAQFKLANLQRTIFKSKDGAEIHGFIMRPPEGAAHDKRAILYLHGGPQLQYADEFDLDLQVLAAAGYTLILPNPRGSSGRGTAFSMAIYRDWGHLDVEDNLAAVNDAVAKGLADPNRLGVGGWSYGGMSTNYLIASTHRFKAAVSGASISNILAGYGTDQYTYDYEMELGTPWKNTDVWMKISYPFLHADRIKTPTLFMCGDSDFNVPLMNSEQMYEALRSLNVATQLVIYPDQYHGISKPSFQVDKLRRYLDWYKTYIK